MILKLMRVYFKEIEIFIGGIIVCPFMVFMSTILYEKLLKIIRVTYHS